MGKRAEMNYDDMPAGPEMNRMVAEKVMGWKPNQHPGKYRAESINKHGQPVFEVANVGAGFDAYDEVIFWPSELIEHAWAVVEKIAKSLDVTVNTWNGESRCCIDLNGPDGLVRQIADAFGETAPLAICRAALKATESK